MWIHSIVIIMCIHDVIPRMHIAVDMLCMYDGKLCMHDGILCMHDGILCMHDGMLDPKNAIDNEECCAH